MGLLDGVRIGPLDPDRAENMGQVGGQSTARTLIRHHVAMHPPALVGALSRVRQDARSDAIDRDEAREIIRSVYEDLGEPLPEDSRITGLAVRGHEESPEQQVLTFTFTTAGGRTGKGAIPYRDDALSNSVGAGNEAIRIEKLKEAGLPWQPGAVAGQVAGISGTGITASDDPEREARYAELDAENDELAGSNEDLRRQVEELQQRLATVEGQSQTAAQEAQEDGEPVATGTGSDAGVVSPQSPEGGSVDLQDAGDAGDAGDEPWDGFEQANAQEIRARLRENRDPAEARRVLAWETRRDGGGNRSTVIASANEVLDRTAPAG